MPVTKKKGAIFAIYADTPPRSSIRGPAAPAPAPAPTASSSSSRSQSPTRRALSSLPLSSSSSIPSSSSSRPEKPRSTKLSIYADEPKSRPKLTSTTSARALDTKSSKLAPPRPALGDKSNARSLSTSVIETYKPKSKSTFKIYSDVDEKRQRPTSAPVDKENADSPARHTRSKTQAPLKEKKSTRVRSIPILADVSEAYGATGEEPHGFRDL